MKMIQAIITLLLFSSSYSFASLLNVKVDYMSEPAIYGNHLDLIIDADLSGERIKWLSLLSGTVETGGDIYNLILPKSVSFNDWKLLGGTSDWVVANITADYINKDDITQELWVRLERESATFYPGSVALWGDDSFVDDGTSLHPQLARWAVTVVDEPMSLSLVFLGGLLLILKNMPRTLLWVHRRLLERL